MQQGTTPQPPLAPLFESFNLLKWRIDPNIGSGPSQRYANHYDLSDCSVEKIKNELLVPFKEIFEHSKFNRLALFSRMDMIWTYLVMHEYLMHRSKTMNENDSVDGTSIKQLLTQSQYLNVFLSVYNSLVADINSASEHMLPRNQISFYQKLLHVDSNQYSFSSELDLAKKLDTKHFTRDVINIAMTNANKRRPNTTSKFERRTNNNIKYLIKKNDPKAKITIKENHIEPYSSCELDCALVDQKVAFESDGPHHYYPPKTNQQAPMIPRPSHHFKAQALREQGWMRISLPINQFNQNNDENYNKLGRATTLMAHQTTLDFLDKYKQLQIMQFNLQHAIVKLKYQYGEKNLSKNEKTELSSQISKLYEKENQIRKFKATRDLEKLLNLTFNRHHHVSKCINLFMSAQRTEEDFKRCNTTISKNFENLNKNLQHLLADDCTGEAISFSNKFHARRIEINRLNQYPSLPGLGQNGLQPSLSLRVQGNTQSPHNFNPATALSTYLGAAQSKSKRPKTRYK